MSHPNALTFVMRNRLVERVLCQSYTVAHACACMGVSRTTGYKWLKRYREEGSLGLYDRPCQPHRSPRATSPEKVAETCELRRRSGRGPLHLSLQLNLPPSTVYAILRREKLNRLDRLHRSTREVIRYEHDRPGSLLHMDVKRTWRIPPGGGRRYELTEQGGESISRSGKRGYGYDCLHVAIDDHSRYLYTELLPDQSGSTTVGFFRRAVEHFESLGVRVERLLTDNALNYRFSGLREFAREHNIKLKRTRPYRPQTNGKAERVIQTLLREWVYLRLYESNEERERQLPLYLEYYNTQRPHSALGGHPPTSRIRKQRL